MQSVSDEGEGSKGEGASLSALSFSVFFGYFFARAKKYHAVGMTSKQVTANTEVKIENLRWHKEQSPVVFHTNL